MKVYTSKQLSLHLNEKGIAKTYGDSNRFIKNDYFQVINAYKSLFVIRVENINKIISNIDKNIDIKRYKKAFSINKYKDNDELKNKIIDKILDKYGINEKNNKIAVINKLKYVHHIYHKSCTYNDFLRMYEFEHELRSLLLKYTLIIENNLKRIFIKTLNDTYKMKDNFITSIDSYNTSIKSHNASIKTLKKILDLHNRSCSKPIGRKIKQDIIVPYWILINEMTFGVLLNCIKNLKEDLSNTIIENVIKELTYVSLSFKNNNDINDIYNFKKILDYIATFRNILAHNQPIFSYNIKDDSLNNFPVFKYAKPYVKRSYINITMKSNKIKKDKAILKGQYKENNRMKLTCKKLFNEDYFNKNSAYSNMNLSYIIYFVYKINERLNSNCTMKEELLDIFYKYNIIDHVNQYIVDDAIKYKGLDKAIANLNANIKYKDIINKKNFIKLKQDIILLKKQSKKVKRLLKERKYAKPFKFDLAYKSFTGITMKFLIKL